MINNIQNLVEQLCLENGLSEEFILSVIEEGIKEAWTYDAGAGYDISVSLQNSKFGNILRCFRRLKVVEEVTEPQREISELMAKNLNSNYKIGDTVEEEINLNKISRAGINIVESHLIKNMQLKKKQNEFEFFSPKVGTLVVCTVKATSNQGVVVSVSNFEGLITDYNFHHFMKEEFSPGARIKAYLYKVEENYDTFQVFLSRNNEEFLIEIMKEEVPEIRNGLVEIVSVARNPGFASIVMVKSQDTQNKIGEVGVCIGSGGHRIKNVQKELRGEKIYVLPWKDILFSRIATVIGYKGKIPINKIIVHNEHPMPEEHFIEVLVPAEYVSKIIGPKGRNIDLISRLLNEKIKISAYHPEEQKVHAFTEEERTSSLLELQGILNLSEEELLVLGNMGLITIDDILKTPFQEFVTLPFPHNNHGVIYNRALAHRAPLS